MTAEGLGGECGFDGHNRDFLQDEQALATTITHSMRNLRQGYFGSFEHQVRADLEESEQGHLVHETDFTDHEHIEQTLEVTMTADFDNCALIGKM